ncbi:hypothetical protein KAFR_0E01880 [Kazachstania africana CBS 2517]|uniref:Signal peptidase complex subunit 1 n=1 Tax=Kazachstania africana (strain ATCC 22294 / BCRC 22015 / CBS 2517 / CECT 1963 / NBRC 1671 / NRRL Y-8276) TaxID=1071382 RepID=H2AVE2_KAZAF|nr:hypothetical protein KAFR_0E01880 [Kazachstania africana CBS 2517]CCF58342.1 hypothetical protein KAFR_0E01880 [Kazachstania africana CBS 2517]
MEVFQELSQKLVFPIDYKSQKYIGKQMNVAIAAVGIAATVYGYMTGSIQNLLICYIAGLLGTCIWLVPAYPAYRKHNLKFVEKPVINITTD